MASRRSSQLSYSREAPEYSSGDWPKPGSSGEPGEARLARVSTVPASRTGSRLLKRAASHRGRDSHRGKGEQSRGEVPVLRSSAAPDRERTERDHRHERHQRDESPRAEFDRTPGQHRHVQRAHDARDPINAAGPLLPRLQPTQARSDENPQYAIDSKAS
jgi:hypothetical protein